MDAIAWGPILTMVYVFPQLHVAQHTPCAVFYSVALCAAC